MRPAIAILKGAGKDQVSTPAFASHYRKLTRFLVEVFPPSENPQSLYPPLSADEFVSRRFATAPEFHRHLARELWTLLREISRDKRLVNGKTLHDHQFAHLIWVAASLTDGPDQAAAKPREYEPWTTISNPCRMIQTNNQAVLRRWVVSGFFL